MNAVLSFLMMVVLVLMCGGLFWLILERRTGGPTEKTDPVAERDKLRRILEELAEDTHGATDIDGGSFQDVLLREGIFVEVPASEDIREEYGVDTMYQFVWRVEEATDV